MVIVEFVVWIVLILIAYYFIFFIPAKRKIKECERKTDQWVTHMKQPRSLPMTLNDVIRQGMEEYDRIKQDEEMYNDKKTL